MIAGSRHWAPASAWFVLAGTLRLRGGGTHRAPGDRLAVVGFIWPGFRALDLGGFARDRPTMFLERTLMSAAWIWL